MKEQEVLKIFQDQGALLEGHFLLSSGLHSSQYLQCARVLENPQIAERLSRTLAQEFQDDQIDAVIGPAMGGIVLAYELARVLGARAMFSERESGKMCLRRGFSLSAKDRVLLAEDVVTTGGSVQELITTVNDYGAQLIGIAAIIDRSNQEAIFGQTTFKSLAKIKIKAYPAEVCPLCQAGLALVKPGSRK